MNFLAWSADRAGFLQQLEVVFTDWNSAPPLAEEIQLSEQAAQLVRFICVPPELAEPHNYGKTPFHTGLSLNVAFRRARGTFIGMMPGDILFTQYPLRSLMAVLRREWSLPFDPEKVLLGIPRKFLASHVDDGRYFDSYEQMEQLLSGGDWYLTADTYSRALNGSYGMWILPATCLQRVRGTLESIGGWGYSDTDIAMRLADRMPIVNLSGYGVFCYDFDIAIKDYRSKNRNVRFRLERFSLENGANPPDWGLASVELPECRAKAGSYIPPETPASPLAVSELLLWNSRAVQVDSCRCFSKLAMASAEMAAKTKSRKIAFLGIGDISAPTALSLIDPLVEMLIIENTTDNVLRYETLDRALGETRHAGKLHYAPALPAGELLKNLDMLVVQNPDSAVQQGNASANLGNRGILFEQRKAQNDPKKIHGRWLRLRECVVHPMIFFRVVGIFRCKKIPQPASFSDLLLQLAQYLKTDGLIIADIPLNLPEKHQQCIDSIYFYTNAIEDFPADKRCWQEFRGNLLIRKPISRQLVRLWNIFARVSLLQWPSTMKTLWRILH